MDAYGVRAFRGLAHGAADSLERVSSMRNFRKAAGTCSAFFAFGAAMTGVQWGCASVPLSAHASFRMAEYFATERELPPAIARAIEIGHVVPGMDQEQVYVVQGTPSRKARFPGQPEIEVWIYPSHKLHQDPLRTHGVWLLRLVFLDGRLTLIEPI